MKLTQRLVLPCSILLGAALLGSWFTPDSRGVLEDLSVTGTIAAWRLEQDGRLYLQIEPASSAERAAAVWFTTPENQSERSRFRELITQLVHEDALSADSLTLTAHGEMSRKLDGERWETACPLTAVSAR